MSSDGINSVLERLDRIEQRLAKIEGIKPSSNEPLPASPHTRQKTTKTRPGINPRKKEELKLPKQEKKESHFLGFVGAACILLATILLIKLSIDSGWLTPIRQCMLAAIFGFSLISIPFSISHQDTSYLSILPAIGVAALHLTTYGAVFYHNLMNPMLGLLCVSIIGIISIWLLAKLNEESYAVLAIVGTYLGAFFFHSSFSQLIIIAGYLLVWDLAFAIFAIKLKKRSIIIVASYLALGLVALFGMLKSTNTDLNTKIFIIQIIQFAIFSLATILFSTKNQTKLSENEAWNFFPVLSFFYGQEYYFLQQISENGATLFAILFAIFLLFIHSFAKKRVKGNQLKSGGVVYTTCSLIFAHAIFIVEMNDLFRLLFSLALILGLALKGKTFSAQKSLNGSINIAKLIIFYAYVSVLAGSSQVSSNQLLVFGFIFGLLPIFAAKYLERSKVNLILNLGHIQMFVALYRLKSFIGAFAIAPLWITYAFIILFWAYRRQDKTMATGAIPLVVTGLGRFLVFEFSELTDGQQVISLLVMGALIFAGGFLYRKIDVKEA